MRVPYAMVPVVLLGLALPAQQSAWELYGPLNHYYRSLVPFSDFNHDGVRDMLVNLIPDIATAGGIIESRILSGLDGTTLWSLPIYSSEVIADVGDVDGDGHAEIAVQVTTQPSEVQVWSTATSQMLWSVQGSYGAQFGIAILGDLDTDGDGFADVITITSHSSGSEVFVYDHLGQLRYTIPCLASGFVATSLAKMGDMDGDGRDDFIVGLLESSARGAVGLISGATGSLLRLSYGVNPGDKAGAHVTNLGDIDADGINDYAAFPYLYPWQLNAPLFSGATGNLIRTLPYYTDCVVATEDLDLDGVNDLLLGYDYPVQLQPPFLYGRTQAISGRDGSVLWRVDITNGVYVPYGWARYGAPIGVLPGSPYPVVAWMDTGYSNSASGFNWAAGRTRAMRGTRAGQGPVVGNPCSNSGHPPQIGARDTVSGSRVTIAKAQPGAFAWLNLALGNPASYGGQALPVALDVYGLAGCHLRVGPDVMFLRPLGTAGIDRGYAAVDLPFHTAATLGTVVQAQWLVFDPATFDYGATARHQLRLQ